MVTRSQAKLQTLRRTKPRRRQAGKKRQRASATKANPLKKPKQKACITPDKGRQRKRPLKSVQTGDTNSQKQQQHEEPTPLEPPKTALMRLKDSIQTSSTPSEVICRDNEQAYIQKFLNESLESKQGNSLYICGSPGTGKSLCVDTVCTRVGKKMGSSLSRVSINAMTLTQPQEIYNQVLQRLGVSKSYSNPFEAANALEAEFLSRKRQFTICVIDEIDALLTRAQTVLYRLFDLPKKTGSTLILIGISNNIDLTDRFLPRLRARMCEPKLQVFEPYRQEQLREILQKRTTEALPEEVKELFDGIALELCSRKISAVSGDLRKCLDICRQCIDKVHGEVKDDVTALPKIGLGIMAKVLRSSLGSEHVSRITNLPYQKKLLLCVLAVHYKFEKKDLSVTEFQRWFKGFASGPARKRTPTLTSFNTTDLHFVDLLTGIAESGLISLSKGKKIAGRKIHLVSRIKDIEYAVAQTKTLKALFEYEPEAALFGS